MADGDIGKTIERKILKRINLRPIGWFKRGPRHLTSNRPIVHPDDLKGMILRVPNVPIYVSVWKALGAKPTPMDFSEVFTSLQQGTIHGQENPFALIKSSSFYEVQDFCNLTGHVISWIYVIIGENTGNKWQVKVYQNPLVSLIWIGAIIISIGGLLSMRKV